MFAISFRRAPSRVAQMQKLLDDKDVLLHEVNHRAKNSIAMAIAVLRLQIRNQHSTEVSEALEDAIQRLDHLARIHAILSRLDSDDAQCVDMAAYLKELIGNFAHLQREGVRIEFAGEPVELDVGRAINVALVAGEAVSNALKHAFPDGRRGVVRVGLQDVGKAVVLVVEDDGVGFPAARREGSMGARLMAQMARALEGELAIESGLTTRIALHFPQPRRSAGRLPPAEIEAAGKRNRRKINSRGAVAMYRIEQTLAH